MPGQAQSRLCGRRTRPANTHSFTHAWPSAEQTVQQTRRTPPRGNLRYTDCASQLQAPGRTCVDVDVADAVCVAQHRDLGVGLDVADQCVAAPWDDQVNHVIQLQQVWQQQRTGGAAQQADGKASPVCSTGLTASCAVAQAWLCSTSRWQGELCSTSRWRGELCSTGLQPSCAPLCHSLVC